MLTVRISTGRCQSPVFWDTTNDHFWRNYQLFDLCAAESMSTPDASATRDTPATGYQGPDLDIQKLHTLPSEQQDLLLLTFVSELWRHVENIPNDALPGHSASIKKEVIKIIGLGTPASSRVTRHNLGQILANIFRRGSRNLLFETVNDLLAI